MKLSHLHLGEGYSSVEILQVLTLSRLRPLSLRISLSHPLAAYAFVTRMPQSMRAAVISQRWKHRSRAPGTRVENWNVNVFVDNEK